MLRGKIFEINEEIKVGGQICPPPPVWIGLRDLNVCDVIIVAVQQKVLTASNIIPYKQMPSL